MTRTLRSARTSYRSNREEGGKAHEQVFEHVSVMVDEAIDALALVKGDVVVDATFGKGGHSAAIKKAAKVKLITIDADPASKADIVGNFADIKDLLAKEGVEEVDKVLFDLGWNKTQLGSGRGFSFMHDEPLNMSYGETPRSGFTASEVLNTWSEKVLADALFGYGEERYARRIAKAIVARREVQPFASTFELVELVKDSVPAAYRRGKINPATRTFQALRIAVNDELGAIEQGIEDAWKLLKPGGRLVVITFHSVEDRAVKRLFKKLGGTLVYKKPLIPTKGETSKNPAARSAKLRAIEKIDPSQL
ncbi:16S rRNA (cytosine(1402)-N(4))-methyltransferase RsmH [Candidatus Nomurabacteria bacterium]|nr:16S rRNA (cytosine(1402)-N(4))-methyltransferase RsmH [Candidatus Nomurabacteria bacterium]